MSNLKSGDTYIYEQVDGVIYAREPLSTERIEVGRTEERIKKDQLDWNLWKEIVQESFYNNTLQIELERVKTLYHLIKSKN